MNIAKLIVVFIIALETVILEADMVLLVPISLTVSFIRCLLLCLDEGCVLTYVSFIIIKIVKHFWTYFNIRKKCYINMVYYIIILILFPTMSG